MRVPLANNREDKRVATHLDDEEQLENLKRWWRENWKAVGLGIGIGLVFVVGWNGWHSHRANTLADAARMHGDFVQAMDDKRSDDANKMLATLEKDYDNTPYPTTAALRHARAAVDDKKFDVAATDLEWAREHGFDDQVKAVATLRLARVRWAQGKGDDALKLLDNKSPTKFVALYQELRGDILVSSGKRDDARTAYELALEQLDDHAPQRTLLQQKLADVAKPSENA